jgi:hypothetical protein
MKNTRWIIITAIGLLFVLPTCNTAVAGTRSRSGSYQGQHTSGTFQHQVNRGAGQSERLTTWQNQNGEGSRSSTRQWNPQTGSGSYAATTTRANGRTSSRQGTVTRTGRGAWAVQGTRTGVNGNTVAVDRSVTTADNGSRSADSTYTGPHGQSATIDRTTVKTPDGRQTTGAYSTTTGKSGAFNADVSRSEGTVNKDQSITNQDGRTWRRNVYGSRQQNTITRQVRTTGPAGQTRQSSQSMTVDGQ